MYLQNLGAQHNIFWIVGKPTICTSLLIKSSYTNYFHLACRRFHLRNQRFKPLIRILKFKYINQMKSSEIKLQIYVWYLFLFLEVHNLLCISSLHCMGESKILTPALRVGNNSSNPKKHKMYWDYFTQIEKSLKAKAVHEPPACA
jgi:hypothetical protein